MLEITMGQQMMAWIGTKVAQSCFFSLLFYYSNVFLDSEAWPFHLVSTISEWVMAASFFCFLLTMWFDFSYLTLTVNCDRTNLNLDTWFRKINAFIYKFHSNHLIIRNHQSCEWFPPGDRLAENLRKWKSIQKSNKNG